jgi:hypothetical protein
VEKIQTHTFSGNIWSTGYFGNKLHPKCWVESREGDQFRWYVLDLNTFIYHELPFPTVANKPKTWLIGIEDIAVFICLHTGKNPGIEAIEGYDLTSGERIYRTEITQWESLDGVYLKTNKGDISLCTGLYERVKRNDWEGVDFESPQHFEESQPGLEAFQTLFKQKFNETIAKGMDYWEGKDKLIFSYYLYEDGWKNKLRICTFDFQTLHEETLAEGSKIGFHTFQIVHGHLVYIRDKHDLVIYAHI